MAYPATKTLIDGVPLTLFFGQGSPPATVFARILEGVKVRLSIRTFPPRPRKQMLDPLELFCCPCHAKPYKFHKNLSRLVETRPKCHRPELRWTPNEREADRGRFQVRRCGIVPRRAALGRCLSPSGLWLQKNLPSQDMGNTLGSGHGWRETLFTRPDGQKNNTPPIAFTAFPSPHKRQEHQARQYPCHNQIP